MAGKLSKTVPQINKGQGAEKIDPKERYRVVLAADVRKTVLMPADSGMSFEVAESYRYQPIDSKGRPVEGLAARAVITLEEHARYVEETAAVPFSRVLAARAAEPAEAVEA